MEVGLAFLLLLALLVPHGRSMYFYLCCRGEERGTSIEGNSYPLRTRRTAIYTAIVLIRLLDLEQLAPSLGIDLGSFSACALLPSILGMISLTSHILLILAVFSRIDRAVPYRVKSWWSGLLVGG